MTANIAAFLAMLSHAEGTAKAPDPYRCCYAYRETIEGKDGIVGTLDDWRDHPYDTGEWKGERLPDRYCIAAGRKPGCISTAAGKYQINVGTWRDMKRLLGLEDFGPANQDKAALGLIAIHKALEDVEAGRIAEAIGKCRGRWASLPGAKSGQPERKLQELIEVFVKAGGKAR